MDLPDFLTRHKYGEIRLAGHRIGLYHIVRLHKDGFTPEQIQREFPTLSPKLIDNVLVFCQANQAGVDAYVAACRAEIERQAAAPRRGPDAAELKRRREAMRRAEAP